MIRPMGAPEPRRFTRHRVVQFSMCGLGLILLVVGFGCATSPTAEPTTREACFNPDRIRSFTPLREGFAYIDVGDDEHYLLTLSRIAGDAGSRLPSRPHSTGVTITGRQTPTLFSRVCRDSAPVADYMDGDVAVHRQIVHIERVASKEEAVELARARS